LDAMPERAFKVNVAVVPIQADGLLNFVRGRALTHNLEVDVVISPKDWQRIKDAGLMDAPLFEYPDSTSTYSGIMNQYPVKFLQSKGAASFYDINSADEAKEELIQSILQLRARLELIKEGPQVTSFEI